MQKSFLATIMLIVLMLASTVFSVPMELTHQGRLTDATGSPVNGLVVLTFSLCDAPPPGCVQDISGWTEVHSVNVVDGLYSVVLGSITPLDFSTFSVRPDSLYLEIKVGSDEPLSPRTRITSVPMASVASSLRSDVSIDNGKISIIDSLGDTSMVWTAYRGVITNLHPPGDGTSTRFEPGEITLTDSLGDTTVIVNAKKGNLVQLIGSTYFMNMMANQLHILDDLGDTTFSIQSDTDGTALYMNKAELIDAIASIIDDKTGVASVSRRAARTGRNPQTGATIQISSETTLNDTTGASYTLRRLDEDSDDDTVFDLIVNEGGATLRMNKGELIDAICCTFASALLVTDTSKAGLTLSKADAGKALNAYAKNTSVGLSFIDSTLNDSGLIGIIVNSSGGQFEMLNTQGDSTVSIHGGSGGGGRIIVYGATQGAGTASSSIEIADLDSDGLMDLRVDGDLQIGTSTGNNIISIVQGSSTDPIADAWTTYSSRRWKENISPIKNAMNKVMNLRGVEYDWKADGKHDIGLIAEEVGQVIPEVVVFEENGIDAKSVDYPRLVALLIEACKEQQKQIDELKKTVQQMVDISNTEEPTYSKK